MKHILIIPSWYPSRHKLINGIFFKEQAEILTRKVDKVAVIAPLYRSFKSFDLSPNQTQEEKINGVITYTEEIWHFPKIDKLNRQRWLNTCNHLFEKYISKHGKPDIIHVHSIILGGFFAKYIKEKYNIPFVITEHATGFALGIYEKEYPDLKKIMAFSSYNIAVSQSLADTLVDRIGGEWNVIPNTIKNIFFENGKNALVQKNKIGSKIHFFTLSNLIPIKGLDLLLDAFSIVLNDYSEIYLTIGGEGNERKYLESITKKKGLDRNVIFLGNLTRERAMEEYAKADFYVSPSLQETFGVVVIEALSFGLPAVVTRCGGPEYIVNNSVGIVVERNSVDELVKGIIHILKNKDYYDRKKIIEYSEGKYSEDVVSEKIINVYNKVLNG
ncbi:glycosyltransferase family 4 protein [Chryseobacterium lactis]|uniref:glycosyltransferase family 4 protein n=1 Tax=Chryseobacterium lactis TaxID=1241981 RepID=UPI001628C1CE|nr:glycosyltransferase family 4 protein [Chryseobacterium lactis]